MQQRSKGIGISWGEGERAPLFVFVLFCSYKERRRGGLARLEQQDGHLTKVKVDKVLGLVCDVGAKVAPDNAVPCGVVLLVKLLQKSCNTKKAGVREGKEKRRREKRGREKRRREKRRREKRRQ